MRRPPKSLFAAGVIVAICALLPIGYLIVRTAGAGRESWENFARPSLWIVFGNSALLALTATICAVAIGVPLAWLTVRCDLPGKRFWSLLSILPLAMPSYIATFAYIAFLGPRGSLARWLGPILGIERLPEIYGLPGTLFVIALINYPFVVLSTRVALQRMDPALEEAAWGMGYSRFQVFRRVVLPQLRPAIAAGGLLVALYALSDFGTPALMQYDVFTSVIYAQLGLFDRTSASVTALLLVVLTLAILATEMATRGRGRYYGRASGAQRPPKPIELGRWKWPALAFCFAAASASLGLPILVLVSWAAIGLENGQALNLPFELISNSVLAALGAGVAAVVASVPVAFLAVRYRGRLISMIDRSAYVGNALPGIVVALALVFFAVNHVPWLYQTIPILIFAYAVRFLPQSIGCIRTSLIQIPPALEEAARGLGRSRLATFGSVTAPLMLPGILAGAALVFLTTIKELPLTLILSPPGFETLVTEVWSAAGDGLFARASPPALLLVAVSALSIGVILRPERRGRYGA